MGNLGLKYCGVLMGYLGGNLKPYAHNASHGNPKPFCSDTLPILCLDTSRLHTHSDTLPSSLPFPHWLLISLLSEASQLSHDSPSSMKPLMICKIICKGIVISTWFSIIVMLIPISTILGDIWTYSVHVKLKNAAMWTWIWKL